MNEDDADQGSGLDTKYRIDSALGESGVLLVALCPNPFLLYCWRSSRLTTLSRRSVQQDCHYRPQVHARGRRASLAVQDITQWENVCSALAVVARVLAWS